MSMAVFPLPHILYLEAPHVTRLHWSYSPRADEDMKEYMDAIIAETFTSSDQAFQHTSLREDLELDKLVDRAFKPQYAPTFVKQALAAAPTSREVILDRQHTLEAIARNNELKNDVEGIARLLSEMIHSFIDISRQRKTERFFSEGSILAGQVNLLSQYTEAVRKITALSPESKALHLLVNHAKEIEEHETFKDIIKHLSAFKNRYTFTMEVTVDAIGGITNAHIIDITQSVGFVHQQSQDRLGKKILSRLGVDDYEIVTKVMDRVVRNNASQMNELTFLLGPLDFYLSCLRFYEKMEEKEASLILPEIREKEERTLTLPRMRNPLLLVRKGEQNIKTAKDIVPNDIAYDDQRRAYIISGPNSGGKTVAIKGIGVNTVLAHNGMRVLSDANGSPCSMSVVDNIYTIFTEKEETSNYEGGQLEYQGLQIKRVLERLTPYSLALFDEVGRGTSEEDGTAFCTNNIFYPLVSSPHAIKPALFFSTHLHQLAEQYEHVAGVHNLQAEIVSDQGKLRPTYRIVSGRAGKSYAHLVEQRIGLGKEEVDALLERRREEGTLLKP